MQNALICMVAGQPEVDSVAAPIGGTARVSAVTWRGVAVVEDVELGEVMNVLGAVLVSGPEAALLPCRQARHGAPGDQPEVEGIGRVTEEPAIEIRLAAAVVGTEGARVDIDPAVTGRAQLGPRRQPVRLGRISQPSERGQAAAEIGRIDSEVQVAVPAGLPAGQRGHSPAAARPVPHPGLVQRVQDLDDILRFHALNASAAASAAPRHLAVHPADADEHALPTVTTDQP